MALVWLLSLATGWSETVILHLRNGDRLSGVIVSEDAEKVTFESRSIGKIVVPVSQIERREKVPEPAVPPKAAEVAPAKPAPTPTPTPSPAPPAPKPQPAETAKKPAETAKPAAPPPPKPKPKTRWHFDAQLGVNLQYNQRNVEQYYGRFTANYGADRFRAIFDNRLNYGTIDGITSANNMDGSIRTELDVSKKFFLFNAVGAGYDEIRKIDFRYDDSFGLGYKLIVRTNFVLNTDFGVNYQEQFFSDSTRKDYFSLRIGENLSWKLSNRIIIDERFEFLPRAIELDNYQLRFEANLRYLFGEHYTLNLTIIDLYDTAPARGVTPNDLQIRTSLGIKF